MYENNLFLSESNPKRETKGAISSLKHDINSTKIKTLYHPDNEKSLIIVEKLSKKNKKFGKFRNSLTFEELKLVNPKITNLNDSIEIDNKLAFHLANNIVRRRFKYFGLNTETNYDDNDDYSEEDSDEINNKTFNSNNKLKLKNDLLKLEEERKERERKEKLERERKEKEKAERKEKERIERLLKIEKERIEKERIEKERLEKERLEKERKEKEKQKEFMKTVEIKIEERNRDNHNYKIIKKLTTEIEITKDNKPKEFSQEKKKYKKETEKDNKSQRKIRSRNDYNSNKLGNISKTFNINNIRPQINKSKIIVTKNINENNKNNKIKIEVNKISNINTNRNNNIKPENKTNNKVIENKRIIIVNKIDKNDNNKLQTNIVVNKFDQYKTVDNVRNKYKKKLNNKKILDDDL